MEVTFTNTIIEIYNYLIKNVEHNNELFYTLYKIIFNSENEDMKKYFYSHPKKYNPSFNNQYFINFISVISRHYLLTEDIINRNICIWWLFFSEIAKLPWINNEVIKRNPHWGIDKYYMEYWIKKYEVASFLTERNYHLPYDINLAVKIYDLEIETTIYTTIEMEPEKNIFTVIFVEREYEDVYIIHKNTYIGEEPIKEISETRTKVEEVLEILMTYSNRIYDYSYG